MTTHDWILVEQLFHQLKELPENDRPEALAGCPGDVRSTVSRLLAQNSKGDAGGSRITRIIGEAAGLISQPTGRIGAYRLVREIGRGGMGAVYLAVRADDAFEKKVAVKFVRLGMDSPVLRRRFEEERRILARLEHPNIARLIDGGATPDGQPYLVMEYVEGRDIAAFIETCRPSLRTRLELFLEVCSAVQCAHQSLIIHRDLKPGNILIDAEGCPKLLDFGIAKLLDPEAPELAGATAGATMMRVMTPDYASPEQVRGEAVTTSTDIYSLGAILYELLTGKKPFRFEGLTPAECERAIAQVQRTRPSERNPEWRRQLSGDLDNIVLKAMRPHPRERYATVGDLAADVRRHLHGEPVQARNYTAAERIARMVRRNPAATFASAAAVAVLVSGTAISLGLAIQARHERANAELQRRLAEQSRQDERLLINRFHDLYVQMMDLPGFTAARRVFLDTSIPFLERLLAEAPSDAVVRNSLALAYSRKGELLGSPVTASFNDPRQGMQYLRKAHSLLEGLLAQSPANREYRIAMAVVLNQMGELSTYLDPNPGAALLCFSQAIEIGRGVLAEDPANGEVAATLGAIYIGRRQHYLRREEIGDDPAPDLDEAARLAALARTTVGQPHGAREDLVLSLEGDIESVRGQFASQKSEPRVALPHLERAAELREQLLAKLPNDTSSMRLTMLVHSYRATAYRAVEGRRSAKAGAAIQRMADLAAKLASDPDNRTAKYDLAMSRYRLGQFKRDIDDLAGAASALEFSVKIFRGLEPHLDQVQQSNFAAVLVSQGDTYWKTGRTADALRSWRESLTESTAVLERAPRNAHVLCYAAAASARSAFLLTGQPALDLAGPSAEYARRAQQAGLTPAMQISIARSRGLAALAYQREGQPDRARELAGLSLAVLDHASAQALMDWPEEERSQVRALVHP